MELSTCINITGVLLSGTAPKIVQQHLDQFVTEATFFLEDQVMARTPQGVYGAQGGLIAAIHHEITQKGTPIVKGRVFHTSAYGDVIEKGRRPGKGVPQDVLIPWIKAKLGISDPAEIDRVNFLIRWKIYQKGFEGRHMFENAARENEAALQAMGQRYGMEISMELNQ